MGGRVGELKQGSDLHIRAIVWDKGETFEAVSEAADLLQSKRNKNHTDNPCCSHTYPRQGCKSPRRHRLGTRVQGMRCSPRERSAVDCRETAQGDMKEETVVGQACEGIPGRHGGKAILLSHGEGVEPSLEPISAHIPAMTAEQRRAWPFKPYSEQQSRT